MRKSQNFPEILYYNTLFFFFRIKYSVVFYAYPLQKFVRAQHLCFQLLNIKKYGTDMISNNITSSKGFSKLVISR